MKDKGFLQWLHDRLHNVHMEHPNVDYMMKLRSIIDATPDDQTTPNTASALTDISRSEYTDCCTECGIEVTTSDDKYTCPMCGYIGPNCAKCHSVNPDITCRSKISICSMNGWPLRIKNVM